ncbi:MAG: prenyltransferase/squalene oxidase repeat-containing protein [Planctomycetota bacterium]
MFLLLLAWILAPSPRAQGESEPSLGLRVNHAISWGVDSLLEAQARDGRWTQVSEQRYPGGLTAFVAFTLLKSGVRRNDPAVSKALAALAETPPESTYGASARLFLYGALGSGGAQRSDIEYATNFLLANQRDGLWGYPDDPLDMSNTQFALLGLRAAADLGIDVPEGALVRCLDALLDLQSKSGAFRYKHDHLATLGMTAATLAGFATLDRFAESMRQLATNLRRAESARARADEWVRATFDPAENAMEDGRWTPSFRFATLWAIERYAGLSSEPRLIEENWYETGARWLLEVQNVDGSWGSETYQTCFALLFLRRSSFSGEPPAEVLAELDRRFQPRESPRAKPAAGVPFLEHWLVAGPWLGELGASGLDDPPFRADRTKIGTRQKVGRKKLRAATFERAGFTNLEFIVNPPPEGGDQGAWRAADHQLIVVATNLVRDAPKDAEPIAAKLWFGFEDGWRIFVAGEEVSRGNRISVPPPITTDVVVDVMLPPGKTSLVVVVEDVYGAFPFGCKVTDAAGQPLGDVRASYD